MLRFLFSRYFSTTVQELFKSRRTSVSPPVLGSKQFLQKHRDCSVYCGYDPTASSLHLGNLVSILMMARLSMMGLRPIFLIGGATGLIGDPSGKFKERVLMDEMEVRSNIAHLDVEINTIYANISSELKKNQEKYQISTEELTIHTNLSFKMVNNYSFYKDVNCLAFLRDIGKYFRMSSLLAKETVANRLKSEDGISFTQFTYSIIQAHDFLKLYQNENCLLQIGGSDQYGNITNGCDLVRKKLEKQAYGLTMPLLLNKQGEKFGKSEGNALYLNEEKTPKYDIYQYLLNTADDEVESLLFVFTFYSPKRIKQILEQHQINTELRYAQHVLINSVMSYLGGFQSINKTYFTLKHEELIKLKKEVIGGIFKKMSKDEPSSCFSLKVSEIEGNIVEMFMKAGMASHANKSLKAVLKEVGVGGVYINNRKLGKEDLEIPARELVERSRIYGKYMFVRWGKKTYQFVECFD